MITAYTVDRRRTLTPNSVVELQHHTDVQPAVLQAHVDNWFPDGVSQHGNGYLLSGNQLAVQVSPNIELLWEYVRRSRYPDRPSRFQSLFACPTSEDARRWRTRFGQPDDPIYEVEAETGLRADMNLLTAGNSILVTSYIAELYWTGESLPEGTPTWEWLLPLPVAVRGVV